MSNVYTGHMAATMYEPELAAEINSAFPAEEPLVLHHRKMINSCARAGSPKP